MNAALLFRSMRRESRGSAGRLVFFMACLAVGVAAVVAVAAIASSFDRTIRAEARQLLAADLAVQTAKPASDDLVAAIDAVPGARRATLVETATIVAAASSAGSPATSQLVELKAVSDGYPFYGDLRLQPPGPLQERLGPDGTIVGPELLTRLGIRVGNSIRIGGVDFEVRGTVDSEPDRLSFAFTLGPRVFVSIEGLERTGLTSFGSRFERKLLVRLPDGATPETATSLAATLRDRLPKDGSASVETYADAQPALRAGFRQANRFIGLVALLSLLIGGIGVAQTVRAWIAGRMDAIAILKCLGMRPREIVTLYLGQTLALAFLGSVVGAAIGLGAMALLPRIVGGLLSKAEVSFWQPSAVLRGLALGVGTAAVFSVPSLLSLRGVPPARVFRRDAEPLPTGRLLSGAAVAVVLAGVWLTAWVQSGSVRLGSGFTAGILVVAALLLSAAWLATRIAGRVPRGGTRVWLRHGLTALARPGAGTLGAVTALGLGVLVVLSMYLVQSRLGGQLEADLPAEAPTAFLIDVQADQWPELERTLRDAGATRIETVPVVTARLAKVDGTPVEALAAREPDDEGRRKWVLTREQRLTYLRALPKDNLVVEGALWSDPRPEVSIEREFARDLGVGVGSTLGFDVQGVPVELLVTSLRTVDWKTFGINFFLVVEPGVLDDAPQTRVAAARLPFGREQAIQDAIVARFPNVTMLRIREILEKVTSIVRRISLGVRILGGFAVLAGVAILAGAIGAGSVRRGREVALLKTLGMTRSGVIAVFAVEYALVGLVAGGIGVVGGGVLAWAVVVHGMEIPWVHRPGVLAAGLLGTVVLSIAAGLAASARALRRRPIEVLRTE